MSDAPSRCLARERVTLGFVTTLAALILARPTWTTWRSGLLVALAGEAIRVWAAGHLEKSREVTRSGPYRWTRHPLYVGSSYHRAGCRDRRATACRWRSLAAVYMVATITAAIRTEEAFLRRTFGDAYDRYQRSRGEPMRRGGSASRARCAIASIARSSGLVGGFALLALKVVLLDIIASLCAGASRRVRAADVRAGARGLPRRSAGARRRVAGLPAEARGYGGRRRAVSSVVEHRLYTPAVAGSNPAPPTSLRSSSCGVRPS